MKKIIIVLASLLLIGAIFVCLPSEENVNTQIVSTSHTVTGGYVDVKIIEEPEDPYVNSGLCYYIENGYKVYENGERIPLF